IACHSGSHFHLSLFLWNDPAWLDTLLTLSTCRRPGRINHHSGSTPETEHLHLLASLPPSRSYPQFDPPRNRTSPRRLAPQPLFSCCLDFRSCPPFGLLR